MKQLAVGLCLLGLSACQTAPKQTELADCSTAETAEQEKTCQEENIRELQNIRQDIRKIRRTRRL